jgi:hypothetical protein
MLVRHLVNATHGGDGMERQSFLERREFLKVAFGFAAGAAALAASAQAAPLMPPAPPLDAKPPHPELQPQNAVADQNDLEAAKIEEVRWGRRRWRRRWGFRRRRRFWGYRRRRFYGFRRRPWRRRFWRRRRYYW